MNIGLTGGIACGKSTVADLLACRGALIIDADRIAREVVMPGEPALAEIAERFGQAVLNEDGTLHRKKLGELIFGDANARKELEGMLHPRIRKRMREQMEASERDQPDRLAVVDVPLLYESGLQSMFTEVLVVYVPRDIQLERLMERDGLSRVQGEARLAAQMPIDEKKRLADYVIDNSGTPEQTERAVDAFWQRKGLS